MPVKAATEEVERQARDWIEAVLGVNLSGQSTHAALKDGCALHNHTPQHTTSSVCGSGCGAGLLCRMINVIEPGTCTFPSTSAKPFKQMENSARATAHGRAGARLARLPLRL